MEQLGGVPRLVRTDKGTENIWISVMQRLLRMDQNDNLAGFKSFIEGKSSANQRIESYWSKLRQGGGGWWINFFKDLRDSGTRTMIPLICTRTMIPLNHIFVGGLGSTEPASCRCSRTSHDQHIRSHSD